MREIKFRIWDKRNGKMNIPDWLDENGNVYDDVAWQSPEYRQKETYELMQYTGLKDKNSKEIYEGDIVELVMPDLQYVIQADGYSDIDIEKGFKSRGVVRFLYSCWFIDTGEGKGCPLDFDEKQQLEIIGNIYGNPELLEEAE